MTAQASMTPHLYVWEVREPDGKWGTLAAVIPWLPFSVPLPLVTHSERVSHEFGRYALQHNSETGKPVRRARYELAEVEVEVT